MGFVGQRRICNVSPSTTYQHQLSSHDNYYNTGLEEFEEKIDKIAEGEDDGENSWISKIYNQFSFFNDGENSLGENDMDGLEPPLLDETWGLGVRTRVKGESSVTGFSLSSA